MRNYKNILVTTYCQTMGLASALRSLFPLAKVEAREPLRKDEEDPAAFARRLAATDAWINVEIGDEYYTGAEASAANPKLTYVRVPLVEFDVFHPDLCGVTDGASSVMKYTSRIAAWTYSKSVAPAKAAGYFNATTFANLGYLSRWDPAVTRLKANFAASDLKDDFDWFYRRIKRTGVFMYTQSHPKPYVLAELAKLVAVRLGRERGVLDLDISAHDKLSLFIWPVYPEIARNLSVPSNGYVWKIDDDRRVEGLETFLAQSYGAYQTKGIAPDTITIPGIRMADLGDAIVPYG